MLVLDRRPDHYVRSRLAPFLSDRPGGRLGSFDSAICQVRQQGRPLCLSAMPDDQPWRPHPTRRREGWQGKKLWPRHRHSEAYDGVDQQGGAWGRSVNQRNLSSYPNLCTGGAMSHVDRSWATNQTVALASGRAGRAWVESWSLITVQLLPQSSCPILRVFAVLRSKVQPQSRRNQRAARCWADSGRGCGDRPDWPSCGDRTGGGRCQRR